MSQAPPRQTMPQPPAPTSRRTTVLVVLVAIAIVAVPLILSERHREVARWYQADAEEKQLDGDLQGAVESLDKAIQWNDDNEIHLQRAETRLGQKDLRGCLEDCEVVIDRTRESGPYRQLMRAYDLRSRAHLEAGEHARAVDDRMQIGLLLEKQPRLMKRSTFLNSLAYYRVLGAMELEQAEQDSHKAVELLGDDDQLKSAMLRCYLECDWSNAGIVFSEITSDLRQRFEKDVSKSAARIYEEISEQFPPSSESALLSKRMASQYLEAVERIRLLDLRRTTPRVGAGNEGRQPAQPGPALQLAVDRLPDLNEARQVLAEFSASLDTRGFIAFRLAQLQANGSPDVVQSNLEAARDDLDRAVVAMEAAVQATRTYLSKHGHELLDTRREQLELKSMEHSVAVIRYHRALLFQSVGEVVLAARDIARVRVLGYTPGEQLH